MWKPIIFIFFWFSSINAIAVPKIKLNDGNEIPILALGTWLGKSGTKSFRNDTSSHAVEDAVTWALEAGYTHIDTAYAYKIEDQVGRALKAKLDQGMKREDVFVTTKLWNEFHARDAVVPALRSSLASLQLDYVDLYLIHWPVGTKPGNTSLFDYTDYLDTWMGMMEAKEMGLAKSIGLSNFNQSQIDRLLENGLETPAALQIELNLNLQQSALRSYCQDHNITIMAYTPFGSLFYNKADKNAPPPRIDDPALVAIAEKYKKTVPQVVLRYLIEIGIIPLPKSLTKSRIEQNIDVFDFQLNDEEKQLLKSYDKHYRTLPQTKWIGHPYYPFEIINS